MKTILPRWKLLLCLPALLAAGCIGQETLSSWAAPAAPADAGLLLRVRPTLDIPPGTWVYEVNLVMHVTPDDPALASKYGSMSVALPYSTSAKKLANETVLLRLPPGICSFTLTSVFEAAPATSTGWVLSSKSSSSVTTGPGIEKEVLEAALGMASSNKRYATWCGRLEAALQKRNEPPPAPPKPPATPPAPEKPAEPPAPPPVPEKPTSAPPVPEKPASAPPAPEKPASAPPVPEKPAAMSAP